MKPPPLKRRCWRVGCGEWIALDPLDPGDDRRRYCSAACEHGDMLDAAVLRCPHPALEDLIALARARLRLALAKPGRLSPALETRPMWKHRVRFLWTDCISRQSGELVTVAEHDADALMQALVADLNEWRREHGKREGSGRALDRAPLTRTLAGKAG